MLRPINSRFDMIGFYGVIFVILFFSQSVIIIIIIIGNIY